MNDPTFGPDDEALSALLDGELDAAEAASLRRRIDREPELAARFAALEAANDRVRGAYAGVAAEPVPERVHALLDESPRAVDSVVAFAARRERRRFASLPTAHLSMAHLSTAIAAGIALAVGIALGLLLAPRSPAPGAAAALAAAGDVAPGDPLFAALETVPSGAARDVGARISAEPRLTFRTRDGGYCRRMDLTRERDAAVVLACRRDGGWRVEAASFARVDAAAAGEFRPATETPSAVEAAIDAAIEGEPLSADAERALLAGGWPGGR
ncbi:MAG TPA: hypothetical protein VE907_02710 [Gammaproteobacteria bacterium]|nr:hypothetical protein [Gammaproteobacteria bacterium]